MVGSYFFGEEQTTKQTTSLLCGTVARAGAFRSYLHEQKLSRSPSRHCYHCYFLERDANLNKRQRNLINKKVAKKKKS